MTAPEPKSGVDLATCEACGQPTSGTERCLADDLYPVLVSHEDFQTDHDGHQEFDCRDAVYEVAQRHIDAAVAAARAEGRKS